MFKCPSVFVIFIGFTVIFYGFWPQIFDLLFPINGTRSHPSLPLMIEYFVNQEKYFYMILFHANATLIIGGTVMLATGTIMIVCQKHACGMFQITRYENKYKNRCTKSGKLENLSDYIITILESLAVIVLNKQCH